MTIEKQQYIFSLRICYEKAPISATNTLDTFDMYLFGLDAAKGEERSFLYRPWGDAMRIPLIKPYEMLKLNQQLEINQRLGWSIYLHVSPSEKELYYYNAIHDVEKIAVQNGVVMAYTTYVQEIDKDAGQKVLYWFVIVPDRKVETGFDTEAEFLNSIQAYGIQQPNWLEPDMLYKQFTEAGCLEWMPDCK